MKILLLFDYVGNTNKNNKFLNPVFSKPLGYPSSENEKHIDKMFGDCNALINSTASTSCVK